MVPIERELYDQLKLRAAEFSGRTQNGAEGRTAANGSTSEPASTSECIATCFTSACLEDKQTMLTSAGWLSTLCSSPAA